MLSWCKETQKRKIWLHWNLLCWDDITSFISSLSHQHTHANPSSHCWSLFFPWYCHVSADTELMTQEAQLVKQGNVKVLQNNRSGVCSDQTQAVWLSKSDLRITHCLSPSLCFYFEKKPGRSFLRCQQIISRVQEPPTVRAEHRALLPLIPARSWRTHPPPPAASECECGEYRSWWVHKDVRVLNWQAAQVCPRPLRSTF